MWDFARHKQRNAMVSAKREVEYLTALTGAASLTEHVSDVYVPSSRSFVFDPFQAYQKLGDDRR